MPTIPGFIPKSAWGKIDENSVVADLIDQDTGGWNVDLLDQLFAADETLAIRHVALSRAGVQDCLVWHFDNKGFYSVRSGYRVLCNMQNSDLAQDDNEEEKEVLRQIWAANVPPKGRVFGWRMCHEALTVTCELSFRGMEVDPICFRCGKEVETIYHAITECEHAASVWDIVREKYTRDDQTNASMSTDGFFGGMEWRDISMVMAWAVWHNRNLELHE